MQYFTRRPRLHLSSLLFFIAFIVALGCGEAMAQVQPIVRSNVRVLPTAGVLNRNSNGVMSITRQMPNSLTLRGKVPTLKRGDVVVSAEGRGSLRKVLSVQRRGKDVVVQTTQAALTDVFDRARIKLQKRLTAADYGNVRILTPGVRLRRKGKLPSEGFA